MMPRMPPSKASEASTAEATQQEDEQVTDPPGDVRGNPQVVEPGQDEAPGGEAGDRADGGAVDRAASRAAGGTATGAAGDVAGGADQVGTGGGDGAHNGKRDKKMSQREERFREEIKEAEPVLESLQASAKHMLEMP